MILFMRYYYIKPISSRAKVILLVVPWLRPEQLSFFFFLFRILMRGLTDESLVSGIDLYNSLKRGIYIDKYPRGGIYTDNSLVNFHKFNLSALLFPATLLSPPRTFY